MGQPTLTIPQAMQIALRNHEAGDLAQAEAIYRQILAVDPNHGDALNNLATLLHRAGQIEAAVGCYRRALAVQPDRAEMHYNLGDALCATARLDEAIESYGCALRLNPHDAQTHNHLGIALQTKDQFDAAVASYRRALALNPSYAEAQNNLGAALLVQGKLDEAIELLRRAIAGRPDYPDAHSNLGNALRNAGLVDEAVQSYRRALELSPQHRTAHSNLLYTLYLHPGYDPAAILAAHRQWEVQQVPQFAGRTFQHDNDRSPHRRIRLAYVSADFRYHVISRFLLAPFENYDHERFTVICFSTVHAEDSATAELRALTDEWYDAAGLSDDALAELIRSKSIDILVDLSLHHAENRLGVFARKPAPVQVCTLAYPGTTGLSAIDYRFTDSHLDPPGSDWMYVEKSARLQSYWCYRPWDVKSDIGPLPAQSAGHVTFACLNNFAKVSDPALQTWAQLLREVEGSRLILHAFAGAHRQRVMRIMQEQGVDPQRVELVGSVPLTEYYQAYNRVDVVLDPFPCAGGTTTCDALWMGVPVVTLAGETAVGRGGVSLLHHVGLADLVAQTREDYVRIAAELARNVKRMTELRAGLRQRMAGSPVCDAAAYARDLEQNYRKMWQHWCSSPRNS